MKPINFSYATTKIKDKFPILEYDDQLNLSKKDGEIFVRGMNNIKLALTKTDVERETDDESANSFIMMTKTNTERESDDDTRSSLYMMSKTEADRERDEE